MFQMIAHGISSAGMFFLVGVIYERVHHRNLDEFGGLFGRMPIYAGISMVIFFAALGLPGLCGFVGEFLVVLGVELQRHPGDHRRRGGDPHGRLHPLDHPRVYLGPEYKGPHAEALRPMTRREIGYRGPAGGDGHPLGRLSGGACCRTSIRRSPRPPTTWPTWAAVDRGPRRRREAAGGRSAVNFD